MGALNALHKKYKDRVEFLMVYIREAHPSDGWQVGANESEGIVLEQPTDLVGRAKVCTLMADKLALTIPAVVDTLDDTTNRAYGGWPDRLYLVGKDGRIAYKGGQGPWGFVPSQLETAIASELQR